MRPIKDFKATIIWLSTALYYSVNLLSTTLVIISPTFPGMLAIVLRTKIWSLAGMTRRCPIFVVLCSKTLTSATARSAFLLPGSILVGAFANRWAYCSSPAIPQLLVPRWWLFQRKIFWVFNSKVGSSAWDANCMAVWYLAGWIWQLLGCKESWVLPTITCAVNFFVLHLGALSVVTSTKDIYICCLSIGWQQLWSRLVK